MQGHVRKRGKGSWEYIADIGMDAAERCPECGKRFWVERRPRKVCPKCGGRVEKVCGECGFANSLEKNNCGQCGAAIPSSPAQNA